MKKIIKKIIEKELAYFAKLVFERFRPYVIGVTGSSGKTTVKYMIAVLCGSVEKSVFAARESMNSEYGLPMSVLGFSRAPKNLISWISVLILAPFRYIFTFKYPKYLILEYAADKPGDMEYLTNIISPDVAVITNIGVAHIEKFKTVSKIAREKWQLAQSARDTIICTKDTKEKTVALEPPLATLKIIGSQDTVKAENVKNLTNKTEFDLYVLEKKFHTGFEFLGEHNILDLEMAVLATTSVSGDIETIVKTIPRLKPQKGRGRRIIGKNDIIIIDESYNANPLSTIAALNNLRQMNIGRKVAILGEMREIGPISKASHFEVAKLAKSVADKVYGVGEGFKGAALDNWYPNVEELSKELDKILENGDVVLVKGSNAVNLEKIIDELG